MDVVFPEMGDSVAEGTVLEWRKQVGDAVAVDDILVEISTDKVDAEVPSPVAGTLGEILVEADETVPSAPSSAASRPAPEPRPAGRGPVAPRRRAEGHAAAARAGNGAGQRHARWPPAWRAPTGSTCRASRAAARAGG